MTPAPVAPPSRDADVVYTPGWIVQDMLRHFTPTGKLLDPCRGRGAFYNHMAGADWCEITEGRDFFDWSSPVDWVVGNPPYSLVRHWLRHSFEIADNCLYLVPVRNVFSGYGTLREIREYGGIKHIRLYGTGGRCGFPMGNAIGAVHIERSYRGPLTLSDQSVESECPMIPGERCHCGRPVHTYDDGFTRDMCEPCSSIRCDVDGVCP